MFTITPEMLTITRLPGDIYDHISLFLSDKDLSRFLSASPQITVSTYVQRDRQRAYWKRCGADKLAFKGDLTGLQYLHGIDGKVTTTKTMTKAAKRGHLAVVKFLHSIGAPYTMRAINLAAWNGHMDVADFLYSFKKQ